MEVEEESKREEEGLCLLVLTVELEAFEDNGGAAAAELEPDGYLLDWLLSFFFSLFSGFT